MIVFWNQDIVGFSIRTLVTESKVVFCELRYARGNDNIVRGSRVIS